VASIFAPAGFAELNKASPLFKGLACDARAFGINAGNVFDYISNKTLTVSGAIDQTPFPELGRLGTELDDATEYALGEVPNIITDDVPMTLDCWCVLNASNFIGGAIAIGGGSGGDRAEQTLVVVNGFMWALTQFGNSSAKAETSALTIGVLYHFAGVFASSSSRKIYQNGLFLAEETTDAVPVWSNADDTIIGNRNTIDQDFNGSIFVARAWNRALSDGEIWSLYAPQTRWNLYKPTTKRLFFPEVLAAGGTTLQSSLMMMGVGN